MLESQQQQSTFDVCMQSLPANLTVDEQQNEMLRCISNSVDETKSGVNAFYLIYAASLVFYMQAGFAMVCAGSVRVKNLQNTMLKNLLDACGAALGFYTVGYAFAWGSEYPGQVGTTTTFFGLSNFFLTNLEQKAFWLFQFSFAATSATIVAGALAERSQMLAYLLYSTALTAFVYPIVCHSIWSPTGFLSSFSANPFLGIGVTADTATWGKMLADSRAHPEGWWLAIFPGIAIFLTVTMFNLLGEGLASALDPKSQ